MGTAGALVGVFTTGFVLVAAFPTTPVVIVLGALLVATGVALWFHLRRPTPQNVIVAGVTVAVLSAGVAVLADGPCEVESAYFCATRRRGPRAVLGPHPVARHAAPLLRRPRRSDPPRVHLHPGARRRRRLDGAGRRGDRRRARRRGRVHDPPLRRHDAAGIRQPRARARSGRGRPRRGRARAADRRGSPGDDRRRTHRRSPTCRPMRRTSSSATPSAGEPCRGT